MSLTSSPPEKKPASYIFNLTMAAVAGQVGCLTLMIVLVALLGGLWLDSLIGTRPMLTIGLVVLSIPVTLVTMFWVVHSATSRIRSDLVDKNVLADKKVLDERGNVR
jgi:hypothetical protein